MTDGDETARPSSAINLAAVAEFDLGVLRVQPSSRRVSSGGREELVEPRVMQALIALAEAHGAVVSRDALIDRCWGGRIVGEDAINRCIAKVRRLAESTEPAAFMIETVSKVGYRLQVCRRPVASRASAASQAHMATVGEPASRARRAIGWRGATIAAFFAIVAVSGSVLPWRPAAPLVKSPATDIAPPVDPPPNIGADVTGALKGKAPQVTPNVRSLGGTANQRAFDAYRRGQHHMQEGFDEKEAALAQFRRAVQLDPDFALALVGLSAMLNLYLDYVMRTTDPQYRDTLEGARRAAERAAAIAPGLGLPHAQLGRVLVSGVQDFNGAWREALRGRALSPEDPSVLQNFAYVAIAVGHAREAVEAADRALARDSMHAESWFAKMHALDCARDFDGAREALSRGIAVLGHTPIWMPYISGELLLKQGKFGEAAQVCEAGSAWADECLAVAYHALGRQKEADTNLAQMLEDSGEQNAYNLASVYSQWHEPARAMQWLKKARQINDPALAGLACDAWLDPIRNQPGFRDIESSLHLDQMRHVPGSHAKSAMVQRNRK